MDQKSFNVQEIDVTNQNPTTDPKTKRLLIIEDEHFISELYTRALTKAGYDVTVEIDGAKGLEAAKTNLFDIILLDIMIPTLTGIEVLRRLRDTTETPSLKAKIIITTNLDQGEESRKAVEKQADGYIIKAEITPKELVEILQTL